MWDVVDSRSASNASERNVYTYIHWSGCNIHLNLKRNELLKFIVNKGKKTLQLHIVMTHVISTCKHGWPTDQLILYWDCWHDEVIDCRAVNKQPVIKKVFSSVQIIQD